MAPSNDKRSARARRNVFLRRSEGLAKKASQLAILTDSAICVVVNFPADMALAPKTWPESRADVEDVLRRYRGIVAAKEKGKTKIDEPAAGADAAALPGAAAPAKALGVPGRRLHIPPLKLPCPDSRHGLALLIDALDRKLEKVRGVIESFSSSSSSSSSGFHGGDQVLDDAPQPIRFISPTSGFHGGGALFFVEAVAPIRSMPPASSFGRVAGGDAAVHATEGEAKVDSAMS